jgi:hypothetical protein
LRSRDVAILALLRPAAEQDDHGFAVLAEIDSVAGTEIDPVFENPGADPLNVRKVSQLHPADSRRDLRGGRRIEAAKPIGERARALPIEILESRHHFIW